ncbi:tetratricopeptide repeat protein [Longimicrobium sp.]|uniref:tetratricopeptide repeat protein n=1 Tax=Longimicrobium sp. TaxID=2029185 RepID=UPI002E31A2C7|nr:tetratricopeptide repeat protein [Longimicrobium sp.]HEX6041768.1 tetratricopeptide repeat protein [Longimicrobium sp.]
MRRLLALLAAALPCAGAAPAHAQTLDGVLRPFYAQQYDTALVALQPMLAARPDDPDLLAWKGEVLFRLGDEEGALEAADQALERRECHSQAHDLIARIHTAGYTEDASARDTAWIHARRAVECDPADGNAWLSYWISGTLRQDSAAERLAARRVVELGFIPGPVMEMGRWILRSAPRDAVLLLNGDWDYFPVVAVQQAEGLRPDVTVGLVGFLEFPWYVRQMAARAGYPVPPEALRGTDWVPAEEDYGRLGSIAGTLWARGTLDGSLRPLTLAGTTETDAVKDAAWPRWDGPVYTLRPWDEATDDEPYTWMPGGDFAARMADVDIARLAGPVTHPADRSPVRRHATAPAEFVLSSVVNYGAGHARLGHADEARRAVTWARALMATGAVGPQGRDAYDALLQVIRDELGVSP